jgi:pimeloyl-ACP methyl ester carboxylesterase
MCCSPDGRVTPTEAFVAVPGGRMFTLAWGAGPLLLFGHATGMCAAVYLELLAPLGALARVVAFDARGHGRTELPADPHLLAPDWRDYRADLVALVAALGGGPVRLAGHSFGATSLFEAAADTPGLAASMLLIEPAFIPFARAMEWRAARARGEAPDNGMAAQAARRRAVFPSRQAARASWQGRGVFRGWPDKALDHYVDGGLLPDGDGVRLACAPAFEAASFRAVSTTMETSVGRADFPFALLHGTEGSTVDPDDAAAMARAGARVARFDGTGHFLPVTHAERVRPWLEALAAGAFPDR